MPRNENNIYILKNISHFMDEKEFRRLGVIGIVALLLLISFFMLRPIALSMFLGLILAYIFHIPFNKLSKKIKSKNWSAFILVAGFLFIIIVPLIILAPFLTRQILNIYIFIQGFDFVPILRQLAPSLFDSPKTLAEILAMTSSFTSNLAEFLLSSLKQLAFNISDIFLQAAITLFTFFFVLRDHKAIGDYFLSISPFPKEFKDKLILKFQEITNSILYGQIITGAIQGLIAGVGYLIFGVPNAILLTLITMLTAVIPIIGAWIVWMPICIYLFVSGHSNAAIGLLIYGFVIVSWIDNIVKPLIVSRLTKMNTGIVLIGMIGGLYVFGILGLIIGPLILAYLLLLAEFYKEKGSKSILLQEVKENPKAA